MKKTLTGAEIICESLISEGVKTLFGYPGGAIMPFYDALTEYPQLHHILVRHEQGAGHAAEGFARATGQVGVCIATSGPGATNLVTPIADAMMDSIPIVCITGQVSSELIGTDAFQETDVVGITATITKQNYLVTDAKDIARVIKEAFHIARTGRPGPVVIDISKDAQFKKVDYVPVEKIDLPGFSPTFEGNIVQIEKAAATINAAKKPQIIAGHGILIAHAEKELQKLAEKASIPVSCTLHGISTIAKTHPLYTGMVGMHGNYSANMCSQEADVLIAIGMRFDDRVTGRLTDYARQAKIIHIDIDPAEMSKVIVPDIPIVGDARNILKQLIPLVQETKHTEWLKRFKEYSRIEDEKVIKHELFPAKKGLTMGEVIKAVSDETAGKALVISDVGQHQMMTARYYEFDATNSYFTSGGLGTMGFSVPAAFGAKTGVPDREVWAFVGDGSFQMTIQELATIAQEKTPVKIALLNNNYLGMVRQWQQLFFDKRYSETHLQNPDFITIAKGFGIPAITITERNQIRDAIKKARAIEGPYLLEFVCEKEDNVFPMIPSGASVSEIRLS